MKNKTENKKETILIQKDIDNTRNNAIIIASEFDKKMAINHIAKGKGLPYTNISNGYATSMIVDATKKDEFRYLLSTHNPSGKTDPEVSKIIAKEIIGEGFKLLGERDNFVDFTKEEVKHINQEKITQEDIRRARENLSMLREDNVLEKIFNGIRPVVLSNWYKASFSVDVIRENIRLIHLSISNSIGNTDSKIAENMAREIIGEGFETLGPMHNSNVIHFMKVETPMTMVELFSNIGDKNKVNSTKVENEKNNRNSTKVENEKNNRNERGENLKRNLKREGENIKANNLGEVNDGNEGRIKKKV